MIFVVDITKYYTENEFMMINFKKRLFSHFNEYLDLGGVHELGN